MITKATDSNNMRGIIEPNYLQTLFLRGELGVSAGVTAGDNVWLSFTGRRWQQAVMFPSVTVGGIWFWWAVSVVLPPLLNSVPLPDVRPLTGFYAIFGSLDSPLTNWVE